MASIVQLKRVLILFVVLMLLWLIIRVQDLQVGPDQPLQPDKTEARHASISISVSLRSGEEARNRTQTRSPDSPKVFPYRIAFSERANFYTLEDEEVIRRMESMIRSERIARHPLPLDARNKALDLFSSIVQKQLTRSLEATSSDCNGPTLLCGQLYDYCGFGCQIRHRMTCVALSYMMGFPLIHDEETGWPYRKKWREAFQPIGSNCKIGVNTINVSWADGGPQMRKRKCSLCDPELVPSFIQNGFLVPKEIGELVEKLHFKPFLWWVGQFASFTLRLTEHQALLLEKAKLSIGLSSVVHPAFGIQIRRTDRIPEDPNAIKNIGSYFGQVKVLRNRKNISTSYRKNQIIFLASDDHTLLQQSREIYFRGEITTEIMVSPYYEQFYWILRYLTARYPTERILGFPSNRTLATFKERFDALDEVVQDVLVLAESDYIVCGISSNLCRFLFEMLSARDADLPERFKSVEGYYYYHLHIFVIKENVSYE